MSRTYTEALDQHLEAIRRLRNSHPTRSYVKSMMRQMNMHGGPDHIAIGLENAHTYYVSEEMVDLVTWAASSMPEHPLQAEHLPSPYGFVWLGKGVTQPDSRGEPLTFRAIGWQQLSDGRGGEGIMVSLYGDTDAMTDREREMTYSLGREPDVIRRMIGRVHLIHLTPWKYGNDWISQDQHEDMMRAASEPTKAFLDGELVEVPPKDYDDMLQALTQTNGWMTALWAVMNQDLGRPEVESPPRQARKRAERAGKEPDVHVVHLRRHARDLGGEEEETGEVDSEGKRKIRVRFWVKPFWRRQWYPKQQTHRLILIPPHERGPADAPLKTKPTVKVVDR